MTEKQTEALSVVDKLNDEFYQRCLRDELIVEEKPYCTFAMSDAYASISLSVPMSGGTLVELELYNTENDNRDFSEETGEYETIEQYVRKQLERVRLVMDAIHI